MTVVKKTKATGIKGMILDYGRTFRVTYGKPAKEGDPWYQDYDIYHPDMTITVTDSDAFLYEDDKGNFYIDMDDHLDNLMLEEKNTQMEIKND